MEGSRRAEGLASRGMVFSRLLKVGSNLQGSSACASPPQHLHLAFLSSFLPTEQGPPLLERLREGSILEQQEEEEGAAPPPSSLPLPLPRGEGWWRTLPLRESKGSPGDAAPQAELLPRSAMEDCGGSVGAPGRPRGAEGGVRPGGPESLDGAGGASRAPGLARAGGGSTEEALRGPAGSSPRGLSASSPARLCPPSSVPSACLSPSLTHTNKMAAVVSSLSRFPQREASSRGRK